MVDSGGRGEEGGEGEGVVGDGGKCLTCKLSPLAQDTLRRIFDGIVSEKKSIVLTNLFSLTIRNLFLLPLCYLLSSCDCFVTVDSLLIFDILLFICLCGMAVGSRGDSGLPCPSGGPWRLRVRLLPP